MPRMARPAAAGLTLALSLLAGAPARAQLTVERIFSADFRLQSLPESHWMAGGQRYSFIDEQGGVTSLVAERIEPLPLRTGNVKSRDFR